MASPSSSTRAGDRLQVLHPGLPAAQAEGHEAVGAGPDLAGHPDAGPRPLAPRPRPGEAAGVAHGGDHHRLLGGDVDHLGPPRGEPGQCRHGRLGPHMGPAPSARVHRTGARSGSPVQYMFPVDAITPRSPAFQPRPGPVGAEGGDTFTHTAPGAAGGIGVDGAGPPGVAMHDVGPRQQRGERAGRRPSRASTSDFPALHTTWRSDVPSGPKGGTRRNGSPPGGSTFVTSAPRSARIRPVMAAGSPAMSTTRDPGQEGVGHYLRRRPSRGRARHRPNPAR